MLKVNPLMLAWNMNSSIEDITCTLVCTEWFYVFLIHILNV